MWKKWWIIVILVGIGLTASFLLCKWQCRREPSANLCKIGTFNLNWFQARTDAEYKMLAEFIDSLGIEVLALQETDVKRLETLKGYLPKRKYDYVILDSEGIIQVAVLYQPQVVSIIARQDEISLSEGKQGLRDALVVDGKVLPQGFDFTLVVVHLKEGLEEKERSLRQRQLELLHGWIANRLDSNDEGDIIIAGDFNDYLLSDKGMYRPANGDENLYVITQEALDLYCTCGDRPEPFDYIIITPDCRAEYIENSAQFYNYFDDPTIQAPKSLSNHCVSWASFELEDLDNVTITQQEILFVPPCALRITNLPESVRPRHKMTVRAQTFPNAECTIFVRYPSGSWCTAEMSENKSATADGLVEWEWTWQVGGATQTGSATVLINSKWERGHTRTTGTFKVMK